ncbi:hypothetical protein SHINM1_018120 [Fluviibacter phosphoraccumulans]|nr:hypothetical protein SHINM1_018120 [Fluviibacter phosphoraccumulans]
MGYLQSRSKSARPFFGKQTLNPRAVAWVASLASYQRYTKRARLTQGLVSNPPLFMQSNLSLQAPPHCTDIVQMMRVEAPWTRH